MGGGKGQVGADAEPLIKTLRQFLQQATLIRGKVESLLTGVWDENIRKDSTNIDAGVIE